MVFKRKISKDPTVIATQELIDISIKALKNNTKEMERALEKLIKEEGIKISREEYRQIKSLTDTANELDRILNSINSKKAKNTKKTNKKTTSKKVKKTKTTKKTVSKKVKKTKTTKNKVKKRNK